MRKPDFYGYLALQLIQGLITSKPRPAKSRSLRVTMLKPCCTAVGLLVTAAHAVNLA
jgi:hypothetical protein